MAKDNTGIDINKIIAYTITENLKEIFQYIKDKYQVKVEKKDVTKFEGSTRAYLDKTYSRLSKFTNLIFKDEPVNLYDYFYPLRIKAFGSKPVELEVDKLFIEINYQKRNFLIEGTAGIGKSTLLKYWFLEAITFRQKIPIFVELRKLNKSGLNLLDLIYSELIVHDFKCSKEIFLYCLETGKFHLFFDGLDEINRNELSNRIEEINEFVIKNDQCRIIVSSRPNYIETSLENFKRYEIATLNKKEKDDLLIKYTPEGELRANLKKELENQTIPLYEIIITPLQVILLIISYKEFGNIPPKLHLFYYHVFDALYEKHDATKLGYNRAKLSNLAKDDFLRVLSYFSFTGYLKNKISYSDLELDEALFDAKEFYKASFSFEVQDFKQDLISSTSLLLKDGLEYSLIHKSFQEFFAAVFIRELTDQKQKRILETIITQDLLFTFCLDMFESNVHKHLFLPLVEQHKNEYLNHEFKNDVERTYFHLRYFFANPNKISVNIKPKAFSGSGEFHRNKRIIILDHLYSHAKKLSNYDSLNLISGRIFILNSYYFLELIQTIQFQHGNEFEMLEINFDFNQDYDVFSSQASREKFLQLTTEVWKNVSELNIPNLFDNFHNEIKEHLDAMDILLDFE